MNSKSYINEYLSWLDGYAKCLTSNNPMIVASSALAKNFVSDNLARFWAVDVANTGFAREITNRSGGIASLKPLDSVSVLSSKDVVIAEDAGIDNDKQITLYREILDKKSTLILICSSNSPILKSIKPTVHIDNLLSKSPTYIIDDKYCPLDTLVNITVAWYFIAEFVNFCVSNSRMPVMYDSILRPNGSSRAGLYAKDGFFHRPGEFKVYPVNPAVYSNIFYNSIKGAITRLIDTQGILLDNAASWYAEALKSKDSTLWILSESHIIKQQYDSIGNPPGLFKYLDQAIADTSFQTIFSKKNIFTYIGYYDYPSVLLFFVNRAESRNVWLQGGASYAPIEMNQNRIVIDQMWGYGDAVINFPGYDIRCIPPSGIIQTYLLWQLIWLVQTKVMR